MNPQASIITANPVEAAPIAPRPAEDTLLPLLQGDAVPLTTLHQRYGPLLKLVETLIGVVPNCDPYLEIWPPAFRTYNMLVPNLLNLPFSVLGFATAPADVMGLGAYVASRTAECSYCSAHTCSFALRRGASPEKLAQALVGSGAAFTRAELATVAVARSLARIPCELTGAEREELESCLGPADAEWIVLGIVMMGFLNKCMDALGIQLEGSTFAEVAGTLGGGWSAGKAGRGLDPAAPLLAPPGADSLLTKLRIVPLLLPALRLDRRWQQGMPAAWPAVGERLRESTGHDFPVLSRLRHARARRSLGSMLRENLDPVSSVTGLPVKVLAGVIFATVVGDQPLEAEVRALAPRHGVSLQQLEQARQFATSGDEPPASEPASRAALLLARAVSPSPAAIDAGVVGACREGGLSAAAIVELVTWISVLQLLHRLSSYYPVAGGADSARPS